MWSGVVLSHRSHTTGNCVRHGFTYWTYSIWFRQGVAPADRAGGMMGHKKYAAETVLFTAH